MSKNENHKRSTDRPKTSARIVEFEDQYASEFYRLNYAWIDKYFTLEAGDIELLSEPRNCIIAKGGHVLFAILEDKVVGTCALLYDNPDQFELAKMAVDGAYQGLSLGEQLGRAAIQTARERGARRLVLQTNAELHPAIALYHKLGFTDVAADNPHFSRCDVAMSLALSE
ncbi:MAG: GNAT family N-acetyltransferase [Pseudomonadota bacterium]